MVQRCQAGLGINTGVLADEEQQLVLDVLRLYRGGGSFRQIGVKIDELRAMRQRMSSLQSTRLRAIHASSH
ncbi:MAG TPA: hypothetical protein VGM23_05150 [Armatimonadota bacterium]